MDPELAFAKQEVQRLEAHFAEDGVHHDEQADGKGETDADELAASKGGAGGGHEVAEQNSDGHGEQDPEDEEAIEEGEGFKGRDGLGLGYGIWEVVRFCREYLAVRGGVGTWKDVPLDICSFLLMMCTGAGAWFGLGQDRAFNRIHCK